MSKRFIDSTYRNFEEALSLRYHDQLNPDLWNGEHLKPEVRATLMKFALSWAEFAKIPRDHIRDVILTGGNANFNYTPESDIDVHLVVDRIGLGFGAWTDDWLDNKKKLWTLTRHPTVKGYALEPYAQDLTQSFPTGQGVYSIRDDIWVERPIHGSHNFMNNPMLQSKADHLETLINDQIANGASEEEMVNLKRRLVKMRREALMHSGEFSHGNLLWKELRNRGAIGRLSDYLTNVEDRSLSL